MTEPQPERETVEEDPIVTVEEDPVVTQVTTGDDPTPPPDHEPDAETDDEPASANAEAAKYRRRLRAVEAERDRLAELVTGHQRGEVERMASSRIGPAALADGADLWHAGVELADLLDDEGHVAADKVAAATARVAAEHPAWIARFPDLGQGAREQAPPGVDLAGLLRKAAN